MLNNKELLLQLEAWENHLENTKELNLQDQENIYMAKKAILKYGRTKKPENSQVDFNFELSREVSGKLISNIEALKELIDYDL